MVKTVYTGGIWEMIFVMVDISWTILAKCWCCQHIETRLWEDFAGQIQLNVLVMQFSVSLSFFFLSFMLYHTVFMLIRRFLHANFVLFEQIK